MDERKRDDESVETIRDSEVSNDAFQASIRKFSFRYISISLFFFHIFVFSFFLSTLTSYSHQPLLGRTNFKEEPSFSKVTRSRYCKKEKKTKIDPIEFLRLPSNFFSIITTSIFKKKKRTVIVAMERERKRSLE